MFTFPYALDNPFEFYISPRILHEIMEYINKKNLCCYKVPNACEISWEFFCLAVGNTGVIYMCYQMPLCFVFIFVSEGSLRFAKSHYGIWKDVGAILL